jgi:hypothetical protein
MKRHRENGVPNCLVKRFPALVSFAKHQAGSTVHMEATVAVLAHVFVKLPGGAADEVIIFSESSVQNVQDFATGNLHPAVFVND